MHSVEYLDLIIDVLQLVNARSGGVDIVEGLLTFFRDTIQVDAVAMRLCDGEEYPYFSSDGFPVSFIEAETMLCHRTDQGELVRDYSGRPTLDCLCGTVIRGRRNSDLPCFTANGSFWTNSTTDLLASTSTADLAPNIRGTCMSMGYESMMLVPIRSGEEIIGLLQLNDTHRDRFSPDLVDALESICETIGSALLRCRAEEHKRSEVRLQTVLEMAGATCHEINQPLQVILGNMEMVQCNIISRDDERFDSILRKVYESAQQIRDLSRKLQGLTHCRTKAYAGSTRIIDFEQVHGDRSAEQFRLGSRMS